MSGMNNFSNFVKNADNYKKLLETMDEDFWVRWGKTRALNLFQLASKRVPAYKDFLKKNKIDSGKVKTVEDFSKIPAVNKHNYLTAYPLEKLCWDGKMYRADMISVSSGSTGVPFFWLRALSHDQETSLSHEVFMLDSFGIDQRSTLFIVSFAMGMWVAGTLTFRSVQEIASRHDMTVITPGISTGEVLKIVRKMGNKYGQVIIAGYPPFVKDIIDEGENDNLDWKKYNIKFLFAAESFSEGWRDYMYEKVGAGNPYKDSLNIYGTADALVMGHETPLSILIRRTAGKDRMLYRNIFKNEARVPTLVQYNPALRYFENMGENLVFSGFTGIPLIRYDIGDTGGLYGYGDMEKIFNSGSMALKKEAEKKKISTWKLPFMYVLGRSDFTATLYGINIYPENIRDALGSKQVSPHVTGKFAMMTRNDDDFNQYLEINVELKNKKLSTVKNKYLEERIKSTAVETLISKNKEFKELFRAIGKRAEPHINLLPYGDRNFFASGVKQKWHKK